LKIQLIAQYTKNESRNIKSMVHDSYLYHTTNNNILEKMTLQVQIWEFIDLSGYNGGVVQ
jgi:hypothetical protein